MTEIDTLLKKRISRRAALSTGAKIGIAAGVAAVVAGVGGYAAGTVATPAKVETVVQTVKETVTATAKPPARFKLFFATHATPHPFWDAVRKGAVEAAELLPVELQFPFMEEFSGERQAEFMRQALAVGAHGVAITAALPDVVRPLTQEMRNKGIPVIAINTDDPSGKTPYMSYIGANLYEQGREVGKAALTYGILKKGDNVVVMISEPGHVGLEARAKGILDVMKENGITGDKLDVGKEFTRVQSLIKSYLQAHPGTKGIFGADAYTSGSVGELVRLENLKGQVVAGGFDVHEQILNNIRDGWMTFTHDQQPYAQGFYGVVELYTYLHAGIYPMNINTATGIIDKSNVASHIDFAKKGYRG
ncbi:MAG: substrate-binding domain-containing protein [Nitrososphaerales archaeon]